MAAPMTTEISMPQGACDCHTHVLGPYDRFPLAPSAPHAPAEAPFEAYMDMLAAAGFERGVVVHPGVYGGDYAAMLDALGRSGGRLRGVAVANAEVADDILAWLATRGVCALRYTEVRARGGSAPAPGKAVFADFFATRGQLSEHGMHAEFWADCDHFVAHARKLAGDGVALVLDHAGLFPVERGVDDRAFRDLLALVREGEVWVKLAMHRNSRARPGQADVRPFHEALLRANPARLVWGSDWPYLGVPAFASGELRDLFLDWTTDAGLRRQILVDNPAQLYRF
jgi:predicted TIM-barrel fold metal-dependent hydrolase